jgi:NADH-quinone oxidoreductase subunit J
VTINLELILFGVLALGAVVGALLTISRPNPVTAVMSLVGTFFALAGLYATLDAHFLTVLQILVYAGAIMVLFIFVVMILNREEVSLISWKGFLTRAAGVIGVGYVVVMSVQVVLGLRATSVLSASTSNPPAGYGTVATVGASLFRDFVFPFEAISLLLMVAIVGGLIVSRSHHQTELAEERFRHDDEIRQKAHPAIKLLPGGGQVVEGDHLDDEAGSETDHGHTAHAGH